MVVFGEGFPALYKENYPTMILNLTRDGKGGRRYGILLYSKKLLSYSLRIHKVTNVTTIVQTPDPKTKNIKKCHTDTQEANTIINNN